MFKPTVDAFPRTAIPRPARRSGPTQGALISLSLSMLMSSLDTSIANAALPSLAQAFEASFQEVQWIVLTYLLAVTTSIVSVGRLGDMVGRKRLLLVGIGLFTVASLGCGVAPTLWLLVTARAAQGLGAAMMMALTVALVGEAVPHDERGSAMGLLGMMSALGTTLGPSIGGVLIRGLGWPTIFLVNVPLGVLNLLLAQRHLPADRPAVERAQRPRLDLVGTLLLALTLGAYALAMTTGRGTIGPLNLTVLIVAAAGAVLFGLSQRRTASPLIRLEMFRRRVLSTSLALGTLVSTVMMATLVVGPFYLVRGLRIDAAVAGLALSVGPLVAALTGVPAGRLVDRYGAARVSLVGLSGIVLGSSGLAAIPMACGLPGYLAPLMVLTASYALFQAANNTRVMEDSGPDERGVVSGMLSLARNLGLITGAAVMGAMFAAASGTNDVATADPLAIATGMHCTFAVAAAATAAGMAVAIVVRSAPRRAAGPR